MDLLGETVGPLSRAVGRIIVGRLFPTRWRTAVDPESYLAGALGLAVILALGALAIATLMCLTGAADP